MAKKSVLLNIEQEAAQTAFDEARVMHPKMREAMESLETLLAARSESNILVVVGATGVGKTAFTEVLSNRLNGAFAEVAGADTTRIPVVRVEAYKSGARTPGFRELFEDILNETNPLASAAVSLTREENHVWAGQTTRTSVPALRRRVEQALKHRKVRVLIIDEAYHLCSYKNSSTVLDTLKSIANTTGVKLVLVGSYDLYELIQSHAQVARRTSVVLFDRYDKGRPEDLRAWTGIVKAFQTKWTSKYVPDFSKISVPLLESCLGCVGLLKSLLLEASAMQMLNQGVWDVDFLRLSAKSVALRDVIREEIEKGEARVRDAMRGNSLWDAETLRLLDQSMRSDEGASDALAA